MIGRCLLAAALALGALAAACRGATESPRAVAVLTPVMPETIDPYTDSRIIARAIQVNVFEPLVRVRRSGQVVPALAESWMNPAPDVWAFHLGSDRLFHDGTRANGPEVVASLERARLPGSGFAGAFSGVESIAAEGDATVTIRMKAGFPGLLQALAAVFLAKPAAAGGLVGTGPYRVEAFEPARSVRLLRFARFHGPAPFVEEAVFQKLEPGETGAELLRRSRAPIVIDPPEELVATARNDPRLSVSIEANGTVKYLAFRLGGGGVPAFSDPRARRAVQLALDLRDLAAAEVGGGEPATQLLPPGVFGFDVRRRTVPRDTVKARALLSQLSLSNGLEATLDVGEGNRRVAERVAEQLSQVGIRAAVRVFSSEEFRKRIETGSDLFLYSWFVGPDATEPLKDAFHGRDVTRGLGLRNRTGYSSRALDELIEKALEAPTPEARLPILHRAVELLGDDLPWIPLFFTRSFAINPRALRVPPRGDGPLVLSDVAPVSPPR